MKKFSLPALLLLFLLPFSTRAQWVSIPDNNFAAWIHDYVDSSAINGNLLDTTNATVLSVQDITINGDASVYDITGLQYFKSLQNFVCLGYGGGYNGLSTI